MDSLTSGEVSLDGATAPELSTLSDEKRKLLELRLRARRTTGQATTIPRRPPTTVPVMSDAQRRMFLIDQTSTGASAYNVAQAFRLRGPLDVAALHAALDDLVARHEVLRTRFLADAGGSVDILADGVADFAVVAAVPDEDAFVRAEVRHRFDLASGRLLRARLVELAPAHHLLVLVTHHIASDAVSKRVLAEELAALYAARRRGQPSPLPDPELQYFDYASWQVESGKVAADLDWWAAELAGAPDETELPLDRPRTQLTWDGAKHTERLDPALSAAVSDFARTNRATLFMVLLAGLAGLLERYSGQGDVVIGSPTTGRHRQELQQIVGLFLNTLPLRVDTSGNPSFSELVARARDAASGAFRHQDVPFDRIVEQLRPPRTPGRNPIFQAMLTTREGAAAPPRLAGLEVEPLRFEGGWAKFDLLLVCYPVDDRLAVLWQYRTALFDAATVERLARQFGALLRAGIAAPDVPLGALPLADEADTAILAAWNDTAVPESGGCLHERIAEQAARTPDALAVGDASGWITYRELDERANRLAHRLVGLGVHPDARVAICLDRCIDLQVAVLAVLKAGGAYVPLDPGYPRERLAFMLDDSAATALLTTSALADALPGHPATVLVDRPESGAGLPATAPATAVTPADLAYVIYTSGTTGRPKGVPVEHRSVVNQLDWMQRTFQLTATDTVLQKTPFSFDVAGWEVLWTPMTGARLFMARPGGHLDPSYLIDVINEHRVTVVHFVPSMLGAFLGSERVESCRSLRLITAAGEALPNEVKDTCLARLPAELWNLYGPTETAITVSYEQCRRGTPVTIGRPSANVELAIVDHAGNPQPIGMPGELCVAGVQVARGYLGRPELTAERFTQLGGKRAYRTGDRAAWVGDGTVRFLGRLDDQVKLRGFRIELGEIEAVLRAHAAVATSSAVIATAPSGDPVLVAYVVLHDDAAKLLGGDPGDVAAVRSAATSELTALARERLPGYMVPTAIVVLDAMPLTPAGKLDRRALGARSLPAPTAAYAPPRTPTEARLAGLWQQALGVEDPVSISDDFFDLGGHSLLALTLFPRIEREFRVKLALSMLFENVTIESQAAAIDAERTRRTAWNSLVVMREGTGKSPLFVMPEQRGDVLTYRQMLTGLDPARPVYGVECVGLDGRVAPRTTIEAIARDCVDVIRGAQPDGPYLLAGYCFGGVVAYEVAAQLVRSGCEVSFVGLVDATPYGRGGPRGAAERPTLIERFTVRDRDELRRKITFVREVTRYRVNLTVSALCGAMGVRTPHRFVDVRAANIKASRNYVAPVAPVKVTLFRASSGSEIDDELRRQRWETAAKGGVHMHLLSGSDMGHYEIVKATHATQLSEAINSHLAELP